MHSFKNLTKAFQALAARFDAPGAKIPVGRASLHGLVLGAGKSWNLSGIGLPKSSQFAAACDGAASQLSASLVMIKGIAPVTGLEFQLPDGITNGAIQIANTGRAPTLALYSMLVDK
jgi:hypothetical protein